MKLKKIHQISFLFFVLFLISFPLSVSISQTFFVLSFLTCFLYFFQKKRKDKLFLQKGFFPPVFWAALSIYLGVLISTIYNWILGSKTITSYWNSQSELHDIWMVLAIPLGIFHSKLIKQERTLKRVILLSFLLCLLVGMISVFTPYRLGRWISLGLEYPEGERLQHFAGSIFGRFTYLPIGLMNTHLTYGGIYGMLLFSVFLSNFIPFFQKIGSLHSVWKKLIYSFLTLFLTLASVSILVWNQSRSIWISIFFLISLFIFCKIVTSISKNNILSIFLSAKKSRILFIFFSSALFILVSFTLIQGFWDKNWLLQRSVRELTQTRSTENQRYFIYRNSFEILKENWILGIGNGQFTKEQNKVIHNTLLTKPWLLYELTIMPKSHAHNDFLQFWLAGGLISALAWMYFWILIFHKNLDLLFKNKINLGMGVTVLFVAGIFQCYMLDDEVALPFYALIGLLFRNKIAAPHLHSFRKIIAFILVLGISLLSLGIYLYRNQVKPEDILIQKQNSYTVDNTLIFELQGCLTHTYSNNLSIRRQPFWINVDWKPRSKIDTAPNLIKVKITILDRDSFDQDKEYKAHQSTILETLILALSTDTKGIEIPNNTAIESKDFPGNVRFRDFKIEINKNELRGQEPSFFVNQNCSKGNL